MDVMREAELERRELLALLETLTPAEWAAPSLCDGWSVRDVVAHLLSYEDVGYREVGRQLLPSRFSFARLNRHFLDQARDLGDDGLVERLRDHLRPSGITAARGGAVGLVDGVVHQQDVRRPLGRPREIPAERLRYALGFAVTAPPLHGFWHVRGTRVVATDIDFAHGRGPEARGPGEAVLMVLSGRRGAAADLTGPGAARLQQRLG